jgi:hypothetical protein
MAAWKVSCETFEHGVLHCFSQQQQQHLRLCVGTDNPLELPTAYGCMEGELRGIYAAVAAPEAGAAAWKVRGWWDVVGTMFWAAAAAGCCCRTCQL